MSPTEVMLLAAYRSPTVRLDQISPEHLQLNEDNVRRAAALNKLPFPTFRLRDSQKSPLMVHISDLARHIDAKREEALTGWKGSQL